MFLPNNTNWLVDPYLSCTHEDATVVLLLWTNPHPLRSRASERGGNNDPGARWLWGAQQRAHRNDTEKSVCGRPMIFFFLRSHRNPDQTVAFSPPVLEFTKPEMPNI